MKLRIISNGQYKVLGWKIYYSDKTFDSTQGTWEEAPGDDVQIVLILYEDKRRSFIAGKDYYARDSEGTFDWDFDDITKVIGNVKKGKWMDTDRLTEITKTAKEDDGTWLHTF